MNKNISHFITTSDVVCEEQPWCSVEWLCRPDILNTEKLMLVRATMPAGQAHLFHCHPELEEVIYILSGKAEQWINQEYRVLGPGEVAHIPQNVVHATFNPFSEPLVFLAILSPAHFTGPAMVDVSHEEPWCSLRRGQP